MPDFEYWFENVIGTAALIAANDLLRRAWIEGDRTITSAQCPTELLEQVLGDLHILGDVVFFEDDLRKLDAYERIAEFAEKMVRLDEASEADLSLLDPGVLISSPVWRDVREAAKRVMQLPAARGIHP